MKRLIIFAAALSLSGCAALDGLMRLPAQPVAVANKTVLDEQAAISVELAYQAAATALLIATRAGFVTGDNARNAMALDNEAYRKVLAVRAAYDAGNASSYGVALADARTAVKLVLTTAKGN